MVQCSILLNGWLNEDVGLNAGQDEKIKNLGDGKDGKADKADKADRVKRGVSHMTLYNRSAIQLSIPEKPNTRKTKSPYLFIPRVASFL